MRNLNNSAMIPVKKEVIVVDLDNDEDVLCGEVKEFMMDVDQIDTSTDSDKAADDQYMKLLDSFRQVGNSYLGDNPLMCIRYEVDNGGYDRREFKLSGGDGFTVPVVGNRRRDAHCTRKKNVEAEASRKKTAKEADSELRQRESLSVEEMHTSSHVETRKKKDSEGENVFDENYKSYLTWLVEKSKKSTSNPVIQVKCEEDTMSLSDSDSDIIAVEDHPFQDEEDSPFVPSKDDELVDLEDNSNHHQRNSLFRKEVVNILKQPYNEKEFSELKCQVSLRKKKVRRWELLDGGEITGETKKRTKSYLRKYPDFRKMFRESLREKDHRRALNLLRGFFFYLKKVSRDDAFRPWFDPECLQITCF